MWQFAEATRGPRRRLPRAGRAGRLRQRQPLQRDRRQGDLPHAHGGDGGPAARRDEDRAARPSSRRATSSRCWARRSGELGGSEYLQGVPRQDRRAAAARWTSPARAALQTTVRELVRAGGSSLGARLQRRRPGGGAGRVLHDGRGAVLGAKVKLDLGLSRRTPSSSARTPRASSSPSRRRTARGGGARVQRGEGSRQRRRRSGRGRLERGRRVQRPLAQPEQGLPLRRAVGARRALKLIRSFARHRRPAAGHAAGRGRAVEAGRSRSRAAPCRGASAGTARRAGSGRPAGGRTSPRRPTSGVSDIQLDVAPRDQRLGPPGVRPAPKPSPPSSGFSVASSSRRFFAVNEEVWPTWWSTPSSS